MYSFTNTDRVAIQILLMIASSVGVAAQGRAQVLAFEHLTTENGLSQNSVLAITQDSRSFMWYGTRVGLNRYDGHTLKTYIHVPSDSGSLSTNYVMSLLTDSHKTLWVGTTNGLNRYNPVTDAFQLLTHQPQQAGSLSNNTINCLMEDKKGRLWVGTSYGLNLLSDRKRQRFITYTTQTEPALAGDNIRAIFEDSAGNVWVGTTEGLTRLTPTHTGYSAQVFRHQPGVSGTLSDSYIRAIAEDEHHRVWIGTTCGGLNRYNPATQSFTVFMHDPERTGSLVHNSIRAIIRRKDGRLWIGTQEGLSVFDPARPAFESHKHDPANKRSLSKNSIHSMYEDRQGSVWVGTYYGGVNVHYAHQTEFVVYQNNTHKASLNDDVVSSIIEDKADGNLWMATEGGGLNYFDRAAGTFRAYKHDPEKPGSLGSNLVKVVYQDRQGTIWAGTHAGGLNRLNPDRKTFQRFLFTARDAGSLTSEVLAILDDSRGRFWVGTQRGLRLFASVKPPLVPVPLPAIESTIGSGPVKVLLEDQDKNVWVGTSYGLFRVRAGADTAERLAWAGVDNSIINCLREDRQGNIWIGTYQQGVVVFRKQTGKLEHYTVRDGLASNDVAGILEDDKGLFWISTANGLSRFDPVSRKINNYTTSDGLVSNAFNYNAALKSKTGELFLGGYQGLVSFLPDQIAITRVIAPLVFTNLRLFNKPVRIQADDQLLGQDISLTKSLTFRHDHNVFSLDFALLNYIKPNKHKYAYRLEGFDTEWINTENPSVTYTNLPAGNYTFWVKAANNDGYWSPPARLAICVLPPFWQTWWAYTFYALVAGGIVFFISRFFLLRALLKRDHELNQIKLNFFTNISHEIRTHLTLISGPIERLLWQRRDDELVRQQLGYVQADAGRLLKLVNELMDFRKAETNNLSLRVAAHDLVPFLNEIMLFFNEVAASKQITTAFIRKTNSVLAYVDKDQLEKVVFNLLSNAIKFTPAGGHIDLILEANNDRILIKVVDNGRGIAPQHLDKLFNNFYQVDDHGFQNTGYGIGLALSKTIVERHKGSLTVESFLAPDPTDNKTSFTIKLQTGKKHLEEWLADNVAPLPDSPATDVSPESDDTSALMPEEVVLSNTNGLPNPLRGLKGRYSVLLVEDNPALRSFLQESLADSFQITECANGVEGWQAASSQIPDLIISDVMMPEMDGFTLCEKIKTDERTSHIPVILLTAKNETHSQINGLTHGADCYLTKPFSLYVLRLHVRNLLAAREKMRLRFSRLVTIEPRPVEANSVDEQFLNKIMLIVEKHMDNPNFDVDTLADDIGISRSVLYKKLKALTNMSVNDFVKAMRLKKASQLLQQKNLTIYEVAYAVGFTDRKYFSKEFKKEFGKSPTDFISQEY
ncbi:two-component regulator propeller domain-containing protein [Nibrella viscosa]|uniref:histidine kinase n=1 Tax=Nibrella viscosa TaxID=1084524 RepID=A0ABP8JTG0_9BACT